MKFVGDNFIHRFGPKRALWLPTCPTSQQVALLLRSGLSSWLPTTRAWKLPHHHLLLVGGLEHFLSSHILGIIFPTDFYIFQRGWNHQPVGLSPTLLMLITVHPMAGCWDVPRTAGGNPCGRYHRILYDCWGPPRSGGGLKTCDLTWVNPRKCGFDHWELGLWPLIFLPLENQDLTIFDFWKLGFINWTNIGSSWDRMGFN